MFQIEYEFFWVSFFAVKKEKESAAATVQRSLLNKTGIDSVDVPKKGVTVSRSEHIVGAEFQLSASRIRLASMLKRVFFLFAFLGSSVTQAQPITSCKNPEGYGYYHYSGIVTKADSGFNKDNISGGMVTLQKMGEKKYDILFVDATKQIRSATGEGGVVMLLRKGIKDATFAHFYAGKVIELYTFWIDTNGEPKYDFLQSKGGDLMAIHKSSIMVGSCGAINFSLIE